MWKFRKTYFLRLPVNDYDYTTRFFISNSIFQLNLELFDTVLNIAENRRDSLSQIGVQTSNQSIWCKKNLKIPYSSLALVKRMPKFQPQARKTELLIKKTCNFLIVDIFKSIRAFYDEPTL